MSLRAHFSIGAVILLIAALAAGCGDDESDSAATTQSQSAGAERDAGADGGEREEAPASGDQNGGSGGDPVFAKQANAACKEVVAKFAPMAQKLLKAGPDAGSIEELSGRLVSEVLAPMLEEQATRLRQLSPPSDDAEQIEALAASMEDTAEMARSDPPAFVSMGNPYGEPTKLANEYGLTSCGHP